MRGENVTRKGAGSLEQSGIRGRSALLKIGPLTRRVGGSSAAALCTLVVLAPLAAGAPQPTAAGLWERVDNSGAPVAWFRIIDCNGVYQGKMARIFSKAGEHPSDLRCTACQGDQKNALVTGLTFIKGMRRNGRAYEGGSILDPRSGATYSARMELSPDGEQLEVRGYLGIPILGQSEMWKRIPDNLLPPGRFTSCS
jgi:uncharacterized protein (DUF2147 family)